MRISINKYVSLLTCFVFVFLLTPGLRAAVTPRAGNIDKIDAGISLNGDVLAVSSIVSFLPEGAEPGVARFFLLPGHLLDSLKVMDASGVELHYEVVAGRGSTFVEMAMPANRKLRVDYNINLKEMKSTISHRRGDNQYFILIETPILPLNGALLGVEKIHYKVDIVQTGGKYSHTRTAAPGYYYFMPPLLFGNFNIAQYDGVKVYTPVDIKVEKKNVDYIASLVKDSYDYYTRVFGKSVITDDIEVYFLDRRGGYGLPHGIILSQEYAGQTNDITKDEDVAHVVSHEIAHLWWVIGVMGENGGITEGLAELSCDLFMMDSDPELSRSRYMDKNKTVRTADVTPADIVTLGSYGKKYKATAYNMLPIIFHETELKIGRGGLLASLGSLYQAEAGLGRLCSFADIVSHFPEEVRGELAKDLDGTLEAWPDYYVKNASGKKVVFGANNVYFREVVPVELTTLRNATIRDTLYFDAGSAEITKRYKQDIGKIVIDPGFATVQSVVTNDFWSKGEKTFFSNKWQGPCEQKYINFADSMLRYIVGQGQIAKEELFGDEMTMSILDAYREAMRQRKVVVNEAVVTVRPEDKFFKITIVRQNDKYTNEAIRGSYYETEAGKLYYKVGIPK